MSQGIPDLLDKAAAISNPVALLVADAKIVLGMFGLGPQWGIYLNGKPAIIADSVISVEYKQDSRVSNYPVEGGAFQSYNKVATPYDAKIRLVKGGAESDRSKFLKDLEDAGASLNLYDVVTPERTYSNANIEHIDYRRTATNGVGLLTVDVWLTEVRITATAAFTNTKNPSGAAQTSTGVVQVVTPAWAQNTNTINIQ